MNHNPTDTKDILGLGLSVEQALGLRVHNKVVHLANHYGIPVDTMELTLLSLFSQEMLALIPKDEERSSPHVFDERVAARNGMIQQAVDDAVASLLEANLKVQEIGILNKKLSTLVQKLLQTTGS